MRRFLWVFAATGLLGLLAAPRLLAEDAAPRAPSEEALSIDRLVQDLASDDFRVREAASRALAEMGEKARPALEAAMRSSSPAVRFRAEQLLARLDGRSGEKALDEGAEPAPQPRPRGRSGARWEDEARRIREEMDRRMKEVEEWFRRHDQGFPWADDWPGLRGAFPFVGRERAAKDLHLKVDGGEVWAELWEGPKGARLQFTSKDDPANVTTYSGKSLAAILEANPQVREGPGAKALLDAYEAEKAARAHRETTPREGAARPPLARGQWSSQGRSIQVESTGDATKVTITESGEDGQPVTKTYEGKDLESIKREHPEVAEALGGFNFRVGPAGPPSPFPFGRGPRQGPGVLPPPVEVPLAPEGEAVPETGPFGLAFGPVDDVLRAHLGLEEGHGALVLVVRRGSPADAMGLRVHDVITAVNGTPVKALDEAAREIRAAGKDGALSFSVIRAGKPTELVRAKDDQLPK